MPVHGHSPLVSVSWACIFVNALHCKPLHIFDQISFRKDPATLVAMATLFSVFMYYIKCPEEDLEGKVTLDYTTLDIEVTCLLSHKMVDNSSPFFPP